MIDVLYIFINNLYLMKTSDDAVWTDEKIHS